MTHLSDVFKFTQGLGQHGHQIGRKVGDAIELLTLGMIHQNETLSQFLIIENGVEGATSAKHKVEFAFYNLNQENEPITTPENLFGIIECKKVGVEQTIKQNFKAWSEKRENKTDFYNTDGYSFTIYPTGIPQTRWDITIKARDNNDQAGNLNIDITHTQDGRNTNSLYTFNCTQGQEVLIALDVNNYLYVLDPNQLLSEIENSLLRCNIIQIVSTNNNQQITKIKVNEALAGPQTPEKAKQASFVSLDVRKKVLDHFDKTVDTSFISILVFGEASHWEEKSRSMIRLCNDHNLILPDNVLIRFFEKFNEAFGNDYQNFITKTEYKNNEAVRSLVQEIINEFDSKILKDMDSNFFMKFEHETVENSNRLVLIEIM